jgi:hypothetical protein
MMLCDRVPEAFDGSNEVAVHIVKRRDFMLAQDVATEQEAEQRLRDQHGRDYIVVSRAVAAPRTLIACPISRGGALARE